MKTLLLVLGIVVALLPLAMMAAGDGTAAADAVMNRDVAGLRVLIARHADVKTPQADGTTALHWAAHWDDVEAADLLIKAGADPKAANRFGATPLFLAAESGSPAMVAKLLAAGADPNPPFLSNGETALMVASRSGNVGSVRLLLDAKAGIETRETLRGTTALIWAAEQNHADVVSLLLSRGANPQAASRVTAGGRGGGDDDAPDDPGAATISNANARGGVTALMVATREKGTETIKTLLDAGAPINQQAGNGTTALIVALQNGDAATAKLLIERGADVNLANAKGWTPLFLAEKARTREIGTVPNPVIDTAAMLNVIKLLVEKGADVNARTRAASELYGATSWLKDAGATAFLRAAYCADLEVIKYLLAHGADPTIPTRDGTTALMALTGVGYGDGFTRDFGTPEETFEALKLLVEVGIPINAANNDKVTALHGAAHKNFVKGIQYLVDHGADLTMVSQFKGGGLIRVGSRGQSVLDWATGVMVNGQSSSYKAEAVEVVTKLMNQQGIHLERLTTTRGGLNASAK
jgi:uncharacterized protein